jgi:hypothetical protein
MARKYRRKRSTASGSFPLRLKRGLLPLQLSDQGRDPADGAKHRDRRAALAAYTSSSTRQSRVADTVSDQYDPLRT